MIKNTAAAFTALDDTTLLNMINQLGNRLDDIDMTEDDRQRPEPYDTIAELMNIAVSTLDARAAAKKAASRKIRWINTDNLDGEYPASVVVHGHDCAHLTRIKKESAVRVGMEELSDAESWTSAQSFAADYNEDFYGEDGLDGCWDIAFYPCTGLVKETTVMTGFES